MAVEDTEISLWMLQAFLLVVSMWFLVFGGTIAKAYAVEIEAAQFGHLLEHSTNEIYVVDPETLKLVFFNKGARQSLKYTPEELSRMTVYDFVPRPPEAVRRVIEELKEEPQKDLHVESLHQRKDGSIYPVEVHLTISNFGQKTYLLAIALDTTEKKKVEQEITTARIRAEEASRAKSVFVSNMSHEIRTPLNVILGHIQLMERDKKLPRKEMKRIESCRRSGYHLLDLINGVLDFSKIEAGKMTLNSADFQLEPFIKDLEEMFKGRCREKGLLLQIVKNFIDDGQKVHGDHNRLRQVLINLLDNAIKATGRGKIILTVEQKQSWFYFEVTDTGPGIPLDQQEKLFYAFVQLKEAGQSTGTGLGLSISHSLVELMGGELKLESEVAGGSRFYFSIPMETEKVSRPELCDWNPYDRVLRLAPGRSARVLVVDDDESNLNILREMLEDIGVDCETACNGSEAMALNHICKPDLIFMDYRMPGLNGLDTAKKISLQRGQTACVVMVTASREPILQKALRNGCIHGLVNKPFHHRDIFEILARLLDLQYEYFPAETGETTYQTESTGLLPELPLKLPSELYRELHEAARRGLFVQFEQKLNKLRECSPEARRLADHLEFMAEKFDRHGILNVLQRLN